VNKLGDNRNVDDNNWQFLEISQINDKIIKKLIDNLKLGISEDFFISFESLLKLGKRAESEIEFAFNEMEDVHKFKKEIFAFLLKIIKNNKIEDNLILQLYNPDFLIRARAIMELKNKEISKYLMFLLPLINDPDDSVRAAVINSLIESDLKTTLIYNRLKKHVKNELNPIILERINNYLATF
jgi:hypothetical protein